MAYINISHGNSALAPGKGRERSRHRKTSSLLWSAECQLAWCVMFTAMCFLCVRPCVCKLCYFIGCKSKRLQPESSVFVCDNVLWPASVVTVCQRRLKLCPVGYTRPLERFISHNSPRRDTLLTASHGFASKGEWRSPCLSLFSSKHSTFAVHESSRVCRRGRILFVHFYFLHDSVPNVHLALWYHGLLPEYVENTTVEFLNTFSPSTNRFSSSSFLVIVRPHPPSVSSVNAALKSLCFLSALLCPFPFVLFLLLAAFQPR